MLEPVPSDQSLPSIDIVWPPSIGKSYSLNTTRAASPDGRGSSLNFIEVSPGPRARVEIGGQFLLMKIDIGRRFVIGALINALHVDMLHQVENLVPTFLVEAMLQRITRAVAAGAIFPHLRFHAVIFRRVGGKRRE